MVQRGIDDAYRGRVFALYDALFNVALVVAAVLTAVVLPETGRSPAATIVIAVGWAVTALVYAVRGSDRSTNCAAYHSRGP